LKSSKPRQSAHAAIRAVCPTMERDRAMYQDIAKISTLIAKGNLAEVFR
jgi:histidine ammonia-lyase